MLRFLLSGCVLAAFALCGTNPLAADEPIRGDYLESRTCDIYTGPCFANAEVGLTGRYAIMAWSIDSGSHAGQDLAGLKVVLALRANDTLGTGGDMDVNPFPTRSVILVDAQATADQANALVDFAQKYAGNFAGTVTHVKPVPIDMTIDHITKVGILHAGKEVFLQTRSVSKADCVCSNEKVFYPPLAQDVQNAAPAFTVDGGFSGRGLGAKWRNPNTRSAFLGTFTYTH